MYTNINYLLIDVVMVTTTIDGDGAVTIMLTTVVTWGLAATAMDSEDSSWLQLLYQEGLMRRLDGWI